MFKYICQKLLQSVMVLFFITFLSFILVYFSSGDPAYIKLSNYGIPPSKELLQITRENMGLNKPFFEQYFNWLFNALQGDFGDSFDSGKPVLELFLRELPNTLKLSFSGFFVTVIIALPLSIISALNENKLIDKIINIVSVLLMSIPNFYLALIFMYLFAIKLKVLPIMGSETLKHMILPAVVLGITNSASLIRQIKSILIEELSKDYIKGAVARGLNKRIIFTNHILKNSLPSIITMLGISFAHLLGGTSVIEILLMYKGVGSLILRAINYRDLPVIQVYIIWMAVVFLIVNFFVDVSYHLLNPKLRIKR